MTTLYSTHDIVDILKIVENHILQYQHYSREMRKIGRGFSPSGPYKEESMRAILAHAIDSLENGKE